MSKIATFILIAILAASSMVLVESVNAQLSEPSIPEFTLQLGAHPYDIAPTATIDPYTGKTVITSSGYHNENKSIEVTIKNQPFTSTLDPSGNYTSLYYNIRLKGHFTNEWQFENAIYNASESDSTVVSISLNWITDFTKGELDFQVRAAIGHLERMRYDDILPEFMQYYNVFAGETGNWSSTQTITVGENTEASPTAPPYQPTPTPNATVVPTETPTISPLQPGTQTDTTLALDWHDIAIVVLAAVLAIVVLAVALTWKRRRGAAS